MTSWTALLLDRKTTISAPWVVRAGGGGQSGRRLPGRVSSRTSAYGLVQTFSRQSTWSSTALSADREPACKQHNHPETLVTEELSKLGWPTVLRTLKAELHLLHFA